MAKTFVVQYPSTDLITRYRKLGFWGDRTLAQELEAGLVRNADMPYKVWSDVRPFEGTVGGIHERAMKLANAFRLMGVKKGEVVSFQLPNWVEAVETFLATLFLGAVSLPIVQIYGKKELAFVLRQCEAKIHVTVSQFRNIKYADMVNAIRSDLPALEHVIYVDEAWARFFTGDALPALVDTNPNAPCMIAYTSGTTSDPKGAIHTSRTILAEIRQRHCSEPGDDRPAPLNPPEGHDAWLVASPIGHVSGLQTGVLLPILLNRRVSLIDKWDVEEVLTALEKDNLSLGAAANFFFTSILNHPKFKSSHLRHLKYVTSGGSPVPRAFGEFCEAKGIALVRGYGSTEHPTSTGSAFADPMEKRIGTDGRVTAAAEVELRDADGIPVPAGTSGEIFTRGPDMFVGYVDFSLNADALCGDGWFRTGDIGIMDADGYLTITDRVKDIIIRGGENISAAEVEEALSTMPAILEVAAVAAPDERMGEHVCAFLRLVEGATPPTLPDICAHLAEIGLARQKWPEEMRVTGEFDRTASGKIKKFELRKLLANANAERAV